MSDSYRDLHGDAYKEWRDERADEFAEIQRRAFMAGFEAAAADYDGMWLTHNGLAATMGYGVEEVKFLGWDVESTVWFSWRLVLSDELGEIY